MEDESRYRATEFSERYKLVEHPSMARAERHVIGAAYGATSYTTSAQADRLGGILNLGRGKRLLDVGAGAGWPGVYMAASTGCDVVLTDLPLEGLLVGMSRMGRDGVSGYAVGASGDALPFQDGVFDAVTSSDVLC